MVLAEILYLSERGRIAATVTRVREYMVANPRCKEAPMNVAVIDAAGRIDDIPELHDRLIAATAIVLRTPLITNDAVISESGHFATLW
jgi:predicted nucleic acid-binding protein